MKLADSLNPATQAENIKKLNAGLEAVDAKTLPGTSTATTGQILKLTGENKTPAWADEYSYTPPAYSTNEVNTGHKWTDGKDVYCKVINNTLPDDSSTKIVGSIDCDTLISYTYTIIHNNIKYSFNGGLQASISGYDVRISAVTNTFYGDTVTCILYYTKPDPAPETRDDDTEPEPEEKKTTRKKTTK